MMALFHNDLPCWKKEQVGGATNSQVYTRLSLQIVYVYDVHTHTRQTGFPPRKDQRKGRKCLRGRRGNAR